MTENGSANGAWWLQPEPFHAAVKYLLDFSPRFDWVGIYFLEGDQLVIGPHTGEYPEHDRIPIGQGICGLAVQEDRDQVVEDVNSRSEYLACDPRTNSEIVALIRNEKGKIVGQIDIDSHIKGAFESSDIQEVQNVANRLGKIFNGTSQKEQTQAHT